MIRAARFAVLAILAFSILGPEPAKAGCDVISATHSADTRAEALRMSQILAAQSAQDVKRNKGWSYVTMAAYPVKPNPFWKSVRPVVPKDVILGKVVTARTYTTCFTGVVVPYVCTSGSKVCGR